MSAHTWGGVHMRVVAREQFQFQCPSKEHMNNVKVKDMARMASDL